MNFEYSQKSKNLQYKLSTFIEEHIVPVEEEFIAFQSDAANMWKRFPKMEMLKQKAKDDKEFKTYMKKYYEERKFELRNRFCSRYCKYGSACQIWK